MTFMTFYFGSFAPAAYFGWWWRVGLDGDATN